LFSFDAVHSFSSFNQGCRVLVFCATPTQTPGLENLGLQTLTPALKILDSVSQFLAQNQTPTLGLIV